MVLGLGTDIMRIDSLYAPYLREGDPFLAATFTAAEQRQAEASGDPCRFYALRFCAKEAVFKALGLDPDGVRLHEIEIGSDSNGAPTVTLHGAVRERAAARGVRSVLVSLSSDGMLAQAAALAQGAAD